LRTLWDCGSPMTRNPTPRSESALELVKSLERRLQHLRRTTQGHEDLIREMEVALQEVLAALGIG